MVGKEVPFIETPEADVNTPLLLFVVLLFDMSENDDAVLVVKADLGENNGAVGDRVIVGGFGFSQHDMVLLTGEVGYRAIQFISSPT